MKVVYDVTKESVYGGMWFLAAWGLFGAGLAAIAYVQTRGEREFSEKVRNYIGGVFGICFFLIAVRDVVDGLAVRSTCINEFQAGAFETAVGKVSNLKRQGRTLPFSYTFNLGEHEFSFGSAIGSACGFAPPPQARFLLRTGQTLRIDHRGDRIYRIMILAPPAAGDTAARGS